LLACLLACVSVTTIAQVRPVYQLPDKEEIQHSASEMVQRIQRMNIKFEKDASGRLTRIISEGVATDIVYDANGKIDGFTTNGATTKARMATDVKGNPVMRFFDSKGDELQPIDLKSAGFLPSFIDSISGNKILPTADMIDVKEFARLESQRAKDKISYLLSIKSANKQTARPKPPTNNGSNSDCEGPDADDCAYTGGGGGDSGGGGNTERVCQASCDYNRDVGIAQCESAAGNEAALCATGTALLLENPLAAVAFAGWCAQRTSNRLAECKVNVAGRAYNCSVRC
jgi:hypothetical protein